VSFEENQRRRRAAGQVGTAGLLDQIEATNPALREYAERLLADPSVTTDAARATAEIREAIGALRLLNAKRELARLADVLRDDPDHPDTPHRRARLLAVTRYVRDVERSGVVRPRPWAQILTKEEKAR
jgi:hypothetical protein